MQMLTFQPKCFAKGHLAKGYDQTPQLSQKIGRLLASAYYSILIELYIYEITIDIFMFLLIFNNVVKLFIK